MLVVAATIVLLAGVLTPSVTQARKEAKRAGCASQLYHVGQGVATYAATHRFCLPPFAFSDMIADLPLSGHWGGTDQPAVGRFPQGLHYVNLWALVAERTIEPRLLICPAADSDLQGLRASLFPYTNRFSTYCLRFPISMDLFAASSNPIPPSDPLRYYKTNAGGQTLGNTFIPLVRLDRRYQLVNQVAFGNGVYDPATDTLLSDGFWCPDPPAAAANRPPTYSVRRAWCHGTDFNVLSGGGAVRTVADDGTVAANSNSPQHPLADTGFYYGKYAERVWQFLDAKR
jgi:hypothetical protein